MTRVERSGAGPQKRQVDGEREPTGGAEIEGTGCVGGERADDWRIDQIPPATFGPKEHNVAVFWSDAYNGGGVTPEQAVTAVTNAVERTIALMSEATHQGHTSL